MLCMDLWMQRNVMNCHFKKESRQVLISNFCIYSKFDGLLIPAPKIRLAWITISLALSSTCHLWVCNLDLKKQKKQRQNNLLQYTIYVKLCLDWYFNIETWLQIGVSMQILCIYFSKEFSFTSVLSRQGHFMTLIIAPGKNCWQSQLGNLWSEKCCLPLSISVHDWCDKNPWNQSTVGAR